MQLLHWTHLQPAGQSNLAAVRFSSAVRISSIRIYPTGALPFAQDTHIVAKTEPKAFFVDVFLNAIPSSPADKDRPARPTNSLVKSTIAYAGGLTEFRVEMDPEYSTRLLIFVGQFECATVAIYGTLASEAPPSIELSKLAPISIPEPQPLPPSVDPVNSADPTDLAKKLLPLLPDSPPPPPLPLALRLMFCLKAPDEDWDLPDFPYVYFLPDIHDDANVSEDDILEYTSRPIPDDVKPEAVEKFTSTVAEVFGSKSSVHDLCCLLSNIAPQPPIVVQTLLSKMDIHRSLQFDIDSLDKKAISHLIEAATNPDIARQLNNPALLDSLRELQDSPKVDKGTRSMLKPLITRIEEWGYFEDALCNTQGHFTVSVRLMHSIAMDEACFGIWLASMITHGDLVAKLQENPVLPLPEAHPPVVFDSTSPISHDEFISFVRAFVGVASTLVVLAWSDSVGNDKCRERTLAILRLWQNVEGYREIVNHLLLLRQLTFRLEWVTSDNNPPRRSGMLAERIFAELSRDPQHISASTNLPLVQSIISLKQPLSYITEDERLLMRKLALVAEDGLPAAVEELTFRSDRPLSLRRLTTLRVSLVIIEHELRASKDGEFTVLQALWDEKHHGLVPLLIELFLNISEDTKGHFSLIPTMPRNSTVLTQLFHIADDLLRVINVLVVNHPPTARLMSSFVAAIADIFVFTDLAAMLYNQSSPVATSSQAARNTCITATRHLLEPSFLVDHGKSGAETTLRALLNHGLVKDGRDPAHHLLQVFCLIDLVLPLCQEGEEDTRQVSLRNILPNLLKDLERFFRILDPENKVHFLRRLYTIDGDIMEVGQWLLVQELKHLNEVLALIGDTARGGVPDERFHRIKQYQVFLSLSFMANLMAPRSSSRAWCIQCISLTADAASALGSALFALLDASFACPKIASIAQALADEHVRLDPALKFAVGLTLLRNSSSEDVSLSELPRIMDKLPPDTVDKMKLRTEVGRLLSSFSFDSSGAASPSDIFALLDWLHRREDTTFRSLIGITTLSGELLFQQLSSSLLPDDAEKLTSIQAHFIFDEDEHPFMPAFPLPETIQLSIQDIDDMLHPPSPIAISPPGTPKPSKALTPEFMSVVTTSPSTVFNSPVQSTTGLTKTYSNNDFRQLRQQPNSARQTVGGRHPSLHVDVS